MYLTTAFACAPTEKQSAIKDMASNLERKWRKMLNDEVTEKMDTENGEGESCRSAVLCLRLLTRITTAARYEGQETQSGEYDSEGGSSS